MEKIDARTHSPQTQYEIRKQVIRLRKQGIPNQVLAEGVGISVYHASRIWQSYWKGESQEQSSFRKTGSQPGGSGKENPFIHENPPEAAGTCPELFQTSQGCLYCITKSICSIAGVIKIHIVRS